MDAETQIYAALSGNAGVTTLVSTRIYPDAIPENTAAPAVVFTRTSTDPVITLDGTKAAERVQMRIEAWGMSRDSANDVVEACETALRTANIFPIDRSTAYDPEVEQYASTLDVIVWS